MKYIPRTNNESKRRLTGTVRLARVYGRDKYDRPTAATVIDMFKVRYPFVVS